MAGGPSARGCRGRRRIGWASKRIVEDLAKGAVEPVVAALKDGAGALWARKVEEDKVETETIKGQLEASKWPDFAS